MWLAVPTNVGFSETLGAPRGGAEANTSAGKSKDAESASMPIMCPCRPESR